jgi:alkylated DNA repair dioxygenase AlkB
MLINVNDEFALFKYIPNIINSEESKQLRHWLDNQEFRDGNCISGKKIPRQQLWFQERGHYFCEDWKYRYERWTSLEYPTILKTLQKNMNDKVNNILKGTINVDIPKLNSILINKYRDGTDSIRPHRDTAQSFGDTPTIVILSIGEPREMIIKKVIYDQDNLSSLKEDRESYLELRYTLEPNSLFIMGGASQKYFTHEIPKCDTSNLRYSLTLREYL